MALQLISSIACPVLTFGLEALCLNKSQRQSLDFPWNRTFMKIFSTFDNGIVQQCQNYGGFLPISYLTDIKRCEFLWRISCTKNKLVCCLSELFKYKDLEVMADRYQTSLDVLFYNARRIISDWFEVDTRGLHQ